MLLVVIVSTRAFLRASISHWPTFFSAEKHKMKKASKFRLARGAVAKRDGSYLDYTNAFREGDTLGVAAANETSVAVAYGSQGREVAVLTVGSDPSVRETVSALVRTDSPVAQLAWSKVGETSLLATGQDNGTCKLWDGGECVMELRGVHKKKVTAVAWHPTAEGVIASGAADGTVAVWVDGEAKMVLKHPDSVQSVAWSPDNGALLASTCADNQTRVWNPRTNQESPIEQWASIHTGTKLTSLVWLDASTVATGGHSKMRERQIQVFDISKKTQISKLSLDSGTGSLKLFWEPGSLILFVAGKGDSSVRAFEWQNGSKLHPLESAADSSLGMAGLAMLPRRALDLDRCEIARFYAIAGATSTTAIVPISYHIPRKVTKFDSQLYEVPAPTGVASCSGAEWVAGSTAETDTSVLGDPATKSQVSKKHERQEEVKSFRNWNEPSAPASASAGEEGEEAPVYVAPEPDAAEVAKFDNVTYKSVQVVRSSHFRHLFGQPLPLREHITDVSPSRAADAAPIAASSAFVSVPYDGPGGRVAVLSSDFQGRLTGNFAQLETGSSVAEMCWSHFEPNMLFTGQDNASVQLWKIPDGGLVGKDNVTEPTARFTGHRKRVTSLASHPVAANVLASISSGAAELKLWDVSQQSLAAEYSGIGFDGAFGAAWSFDGAVLGSVCRDGKLYVTDPRIKGDPSISLTGHELGEKATSLVWGRESHTLLSTGFGKGSQRQVKLYDIRNGGKEVAVHNMDISNGAITPHFDVDTGVLFLAGRGDISVTFIEVTPQDDKKLHHLGAFRGKDPQLGTCFLPKQFANVLDVELVRMLRLTANTIEPVQLIVPRQRKEFFQDDLFVPTRSSTRPAISQASEWLSGKNASPILEDLQPKDMTKLSEAPEVEKEKKPSSAYFLQKAAEEAAERESSANAKDTLFAKVNRFDTSKVEENIAPTEVDEDEWDE